MLAIALPSTAPIPHRLILTLIGQGQALPLPYTKCRRGSFRGMARWPGQGHHWPGQGQALPLPYTKCRRGPFRGMARWPGQDQGVILAVALAACKNPTCILRKLIR